MTDNYPEPEGGDTQNPGADPGPPVATDEETRGQVIEHGRANG